MLCTKLDWQGPGWYTARLQEMPKETGYPSELQELPSQGVDQDGKDVLLLVEYMGTGRRPADTLVPPVWCYQEGYAYSCWSKIYRWWGAVEAAQTALENCTQEKVDTQIDWVDRFMPLTAQKEVTFSPGETYLGRRKRWLSHLQSGRKRTEKDDLFGGGPYGGGVP